MDVKPASEVDRLTSNLQVYEGLVKDQAAEIAALKAEVAFLKKQVHNRENSSRQEGKVSVICFLYFITLTNIVPRREQSQRFPTRTLSLAGLLSGKPLSVPRQSPEDRLTTL